MIEMVTREKRAPNNEVGDWKKLSWSEFERRAATGNPVPGVLAPPSDADLDRLTPAFSSLGWLFQKSPEVLSSITPPDFNRPVPLPHDALLSDVYRNVSSLLSWETGDQWIEGPPESEGAFRLPATRVGDTSAGSNHVSPGFFPPPERWDLLLFNRWRELPQTACGPNTGPYASRRCRQLADQHPQKDDFLVAKFQ